jgi:hypothetical protein
VQRTGEVTYMRGTHWHRSELDQLH